METDCFKFIPAFLPKTSGELRKLHNEHIINLYS